MMKQSTRPSFASQKLDRERISEPLVRCGAVLDLLVVACVFFGGGRDLSNQVQCVVERGCCITLY